MIDACCALFFLRSSGPELPRPVFLSFSSLTLPGRRVFFSGLRRNSSPRLFRVLPGRRGLSFCCVLVGSGFLRPVLISLAHFSAFHGSAFYECASVYFLDLAWPRPFPSASPSSASPFCVPSFWLRCRDESLTAQRSSSFPERSPLFPPPLV